MRTLFRILPFLWTIGCLLLLIFVDKIDLDNYVTPPPDIPLDDWIIKFILVGMASLAVSIGLSFIWFFISKKFFIFTVDTLKSYWHELWWIGLLVCCFVASFFLTWNFLGTTSEGAIYVYMFITLCCGSIPYYLITLIYSPHGVKFIPWFSYHIRK